jgi:uncharacterized Zn finger protein
MNLHNFDYDISPKILRRGEDYYECDAIDNVEHRYPGMWMAEVEGSDIYSVDIELAGDEIVSWDCDCPYDHGDICKHVVAFLLYIRENGDEHPVGCEIPPSLTQKRLSKILKRTNRRELILFLSRYAENDPDFYRAVVSNFSDDYTELHNLNS